MKGCCRKYKLNKQIHYTKSETRYKKKIKKEQSNCAWFSGFPLQQNEKRMALRSSKNQIDGILSRIFIHSHCKARSHNPKGGCACRDPDLTYCVQGLNITTSQNSITENGNRLNSLYWYKAIVRCTHLVARILQHGCKFSSLPKVIKITVHHQSATKFAFVLQDI